MAAVLASAGCGAKGDPVPIQRHPAAACEVRALNLRTFEAVLPTLDVNGKRLAGIEAIQVYYLQMGTGFPTAMDVFQNGQVIFEMRRPDIPSPGKPITLDLYDFGRPPGWLVVVAFRVGTSAGRETTKNARNRVIPGEPSRVLPWLDPVF
jgi:hypothetical protein